jgi:hypothetical protein
MHSIQKKSPSQAGLFQPFVLREQLKRAGWREQTPDTAMRTDREVTDRAGTYARATWWNRGRQLLILVEQDFLEPEGAIAFIAIPTTNARTTSRAIAGKSRPHRGTP